MEEDNEKGLNVEDLMETTEEITYGLFYSRRSHFSGLYFSMYSLNIYATKQVKHRYQI